MRKIVDFHDMIPIRGNREVGFAHLLREPVNLLLRVYKDDGLRDRQRIVQIAKGVELPLLLFHGDEELLDPLKRQFIALHQDAEGIRHELVRHLQNLVRQSRGDKHDLGPRRKVPRQQLQAVRRLTRST